MTDKPSTKPSISRKQQKDKSKRGSVQYAVRRGPLRSKHQILDDFVTEKRFYFSQKVGFSPKTEEFYPLLSASDQKTLRSQSRFLVSQVFGTTMPEFKLARQYSQIAADSLGQVSHVFALNYRTIINYTYWTNIFDEYLIHSGHFSFHFYGCPAAADLFTVVACVDYDDNSSLPDFNTGCGYDSAIVFSPLHPGYKTQTLNFRSYLPPDAVWTTTASDLTVAYIKMQSDRATSNVISKNIGVCTGHFLVQFRQITI